MELMKKHKQYVGEIKGLDREQRTLMALVSTDSVDRDGDVIVPSGWQLDNYRKNPVVLWAHRYDRLPIGKALSIEPSEHGLLALVQFAEHELAADVFELYAGGFMRAFSVGFRPITYEPRKDERTRGFLIKEAELLEFSAVPVPANQDALVLAAKAAKLCGVGMTCAACEERDASRLTPDEPEHYLDLPAQTRAGDADEHTRAIETEAAQTRAELSASIAALREMTAGLRTQD